MTTQTEIKTIKAAKEAGYREPKDYEYDFVDVITIKGKTLIRDAKEAISDSAWRKKGMRVRTGEIENPQAWRRFGFRGQGSVEFGVYRDNQIEPIRKFVKPPAGDTSDMLTVLAAIFAVNRSAKRMRDAAGKHYQNRMHGFSGHAKSKKELLYRMKDAGLIHAIKNGWLSPQGWHGGLCVIAGNGYCFHSSLYPCDFARTEQEQEAVTIEAKPRESREMKLSLAVATLETLPRDTTGFSSASVPTHEKWSDFGGTDDQDFDADNEDWSDDD